MRVLLLSNYYPEHIGGIETVAEILAAGYRRRGHDVRWIAADIAARPHHPGPGDEPVRVWNGIERIGFPYPLPSPGAAAGISRAVAWSQVLHVHDSLYAINAAAFLLAKRHGRPVLLTQHVAKVPYPNPIYRAMQSAAYATIGRYVLSRADQVVFVSEEVRRWFGSRVRFRKPAILIEYGIDTDQFQPSSPEERRNMRSRLGVNGTTPLLLFVGRFVEKKGIRLLRSLVEATPQFQWLMIGRAGDIEPRAWRLPNLRVLPAMKPPELRTYYAAADLLVLPSSGEGFPVVAEEAMACGTPALLSVKTADGLPAVRDLLFTSTLAPADLSSVVGSAVDTVMSDGSLRDRVAERARERWRADTMVDRYEVELLKLVR